MENSIVKQLSQALDLLKDYPNIEKIIDLPAAQRFVSAFRNTDIDLVPNFKNIESEKIEQLIRKDAGSVREWFKALDCYDQVNVWIDEDPNDDRCIFYGNVCANLKDYNSWLESGKDCVPLYFGFSTNNEASFTNDEDEEIEGTWEEVYLAIVKHVNEKLTIPSVPDEEE